MAGTIQQLCNVALVKPSEEHKRPLTPSHYDLLWQEFFRDPSQWWDNRNSKVGSAFPDFKHKSSKECLWIDGRFNPSWVRQELRRRGLAMSSQAPHGQLLAENEKALPFSNDPAAFVASLRSCAKIKDLPQGVRLHDEILKLGLVEKCSDALATMYAKCGELAKARELLIMHKSRDLYSWTALITGYTRNGRGQDAFNCFEQMKHLGLSMDVVTFTSILKACGSMKAADKGKQVHDEIARQGLLESDIVLGNAIVDMYAKCGALRKAQQVLEELPLQNACSWNALIIGYVQQGQDQQALNCFEQMQCEGLSPNAVTFASVLKACGSVGAASKGEQIHDEISKQGLLRNNVVLGTALVDMYAKFGALTKAQQVLEELPFRDVVSWNALIAGYAQNGHGEQALKCYEWMQIEGLSPNAITFTCILKACGSIGAVDKGEKIRDEIVKQGLLRKDIALGNALVDMYVKCRALAKAHQALKELPFRNVACWNALIAGYAHLDEAEQAVNCYEQMQREGHAPDAVTFACILKACGTLGTIDKGEEIHEQISKQGLLKKDMVLGNALVDMYAKCGALAKAQRALLKLPSRDVNSWTALITGYAQQGQGQEALNCFKLMQDEGLSPDRVTFSCVLNACSHLGLVEDGYMYFSKMSTQFGMKPDVEHYTCMVDLFGRAGHLDKAVEVLQEMPSTDDSGVWSALLGSCLKWRDASVGRWAFEQAVRVGKGDAAPYVLMANIYAAAGLQEDAEIIEAMRMENKAWKMPGPSWHMKTREDASKMKGKREHAHMYVEAKLYKSAATV